MITHWLEHNRGRRWSQFNRRAVVLWIGGVLMNHIPRPTQTLSVMTAILDASLDTAARLEIEISELESDLRTSTNDWRSQTVTFRLTNARAKLSAEIKRAADALRILEGLRDKSGMDSHLLVRVFNELKGT